MFDRKNFEAILQKRFVYAPSFEIYGGCAGLYDYGPIGTALLNNLLSVWRSHFVVMEDMLEIDCTNLTLHSVLETSGHVDKFQDFMVKDTSNGNVYRVDHLVKQELESRITKMKISDSDINDYQTILSQLDNYDPQKISEIIERYDIKAPITNADLSCPEAFNLMFQTTIGPSSSGTAAFLRPETAQGQFVNFKRLLEFNCGKIPFASACVGKSFRNEISPRQGLLRVREFTMAEIEHYVDPRKKDHGKFHTVRNVRVNLFAADSQLDNKKPVPTSVGEAVDKKIINNETLGYFIARIQLYLLKVGIDPTRLRFRQHMKNEMAHYACDCWDAEIETSFGWIECVGCADRSAFDLSVHGEKTKQKLVGQVALAQPLVQNKMIMSTDKSLMGKTFRRDMEYIRPIIDSLNECSHHQAVELKKQMECQGSISITGTNNQQYHLTPQMISFQEKTETVHTESFVPNVIEPSFGMGRIMYALMEHVWHKRPTKNEEIRSVLSFPSCVAPIFVLLLPLSNHSGFDQIIASLAEKLRGEGIPIRIDDSGTTIGKRYARNDEIGTPFALTVDFQTLEDGTVTFRERDSMLQVRMNMEQCITCLRDLRVGKLSWEDIYAVHPKVSQETSMP